jgi:hypothetical protein
LPVFVDLGYERVTLEEVLDDERVGEVGLAVVSLGGFGIIDIFGGFVSFSQMYLAGKM